MTTTSDRPLPAAGEPGRPSTAPAPPPAAVPSAREPGGADALRRLLRRVHFYAGVLVAPFLAILCLSGIAYVFTPQINDLIHAQELRVTPQAGPVAPLDEQVAAARAAYPGVPLTSVQPAAAPDRTTAVVLTPPGAAEGETLGVYVDPYTAQITGALPLLDGEPPVQHWLRTLHGDLHLGTVGGIYSEFAASWLPVLFAGGLVLWFGKRRARRRDLVVPASGRPGRLRIMSWHGSVGIWLTAALVFISLTGLTWSTFAGERFQTVLTGLGARTPTLSTDPLPAPPTASSVIGAGQAETIGRAAGFEGPLTIAPPAEPGEPFLVAETSSTVPLHRDKIALDPYTGEVVETLAFADYPFLAKLTTIGILAHTGTLFGLVNQLAMTAMALGVLAMLFWGYRMWWQRRPTRGGAPRPLERRGVLRTTPQPVLFAVVLVAVLAGWLMPVLGASLVVFLVADTAWAAVGRRRATTAAG
ncbi:PepSY-associated TM helix domain-containing protein [Pseudonocardia xinjiangensis]|uniref:PepSY-associated TM helix domain-containing protein n=1 Tax=Pseudonocardia xinjiangensis TaxID=75289 RepID=UPI003D9507B0